MSALRPTGRTMAIALCFLFVCAVLEANASPSQIQRSFPSVRSGAPIAAAMSNDTRVGTNLASFVLSRRYARGLCGCDETGTSVV